MYTYVRLINFNFHRSEDSQGEAKRINLTKISTDSVATDLATNSALPLTTSNQDSTVSNVPASNIHLKRKTLDKVR